MTPRAQLAANRQFGWFFTIVCFILATYSFLNDWERATITLLGSAMMLAVVTLFFSRLLTTVTRLWYGFGLLLGKVVSPIVLGVIFFVLITPVALITRRFGRDELRLKKRSVDSYWIDRSPPNPSSDSFKRQY